MRALSLTLVLLLALSGRAEDSARPKRIHLKLPVLPSFLEHAAAPPLECQDDEDDELDAAPEECLPLLTPVDGPPIDAEPIEAARLASHHLSLSPVLEHGPYLHGDDIWKAAYTLDLQAGLEWKATHKLTIDCGYGLALRTAELLGTPEYLRQGPWLSLKWDF